jgi:hypothetical protein
LIDEIEESPQQQQQQMHDAQQAQTESHFTHKKNCELKMFKAQVAIYH